eukprot:2242824-Amphidinium_carterae.1
MFKVLSEIKFSGKAWVCCVVLSFLVWCPSICQALRGTHVEGRDGGQPYAVLNLANTDARELGHARTCTPHGARVRCHQRAKAFVVVKQRSRAIIEP